MCILKQKNKQDSTTSPLKKNENNLSEVTPNLPRGTNTVRNILTPVMARKSPVSNNDPDNEIKTVKVTDMTNAPIQVKSIGSLFSSINKSVSSAFNSFMSAATNSDPAANTQNQVQPPTTNSRTMFATRNPPNTTTPATTANNATGSTTPSIFVPNITVSSTGNLPSKQINVGAGTSVNNTGVKPSPPGASASFHHIDENQKRNPNEHRQNQSSPQKLSNSPSGNFGRSSPRNQRSRSPSPRREIGFSAAVTNIVEQAHELAEHDRRKGYRFKKCKYKTSVMCM